jgi:hypothetical protein
MRDDRAFQVTVDDEVQQELDRVFGPEEPREEKKIAPRPPPVKATGKPPEVKKLDPKGMRKPQCPAGDNVVLPKHYARFQIEPIRFIGENRLNFFQGNVIKYILRYDAKNGLEDVRKAKRYCRMFELFLMDHPDWNGPDPEEKDRQAEVAAIFAQIRAAVAKAVQDADPRCSREQLVSQIRGAITIVESKHHENPQ